MKDKKILILTNNFPYFPGEQFLEEEIKFWSNSYGGSVMVAPVNFSEERRVLPDNIELGDVLGQNRTFINICRSVLFPFYSLFFYREVYFLIKNKKQSLLHCCFLAFQKCRAISFAYFGLKKILKKNNDISVAYCYWCDLSAYAAVLLKKEGLLAKVSARAHRYDLYQEFQPYSYMPFKAYFLKYIDEVFAISNEGKEYLISTYNVDSRKVYVKPLGVRVSGAISQAEVSNIFTIVSVSYCVPVKRIDKIIKSIKKLAELNDTITFNWYHIGSGPESDDLQSLAKRLFNQKNIEWKFCGELSNHDVQQFLLQNKVDVFINTSESEGVPVSIMEAMAVGIPAIAPAVGGISEIVNNYNGVLMSADPDPVEIVEALSKFKYFKNLETRKRAKETISVFYNSDINYQKFVEHFDFD